MSIENSPLGYIYPLGLAWQATLGLDGEAGFLFDFGGGEHFSLKPELLPRGVAKLAWECG